MTLPSASSDRTLHIYLTLAQYPILSTQIRTRMRRELFERGVITPQNFEAEVKEKAIHSQEMEALHDPFTEEPVDVWELRLSRVRDHLTDFYFAYNLPHDLFNQIVRESLSERGAVIEDLQVSFNPELAPQSMLFEHALAIESMPKEDRTEYAARLREIIVVLIRTMISDQLAYVNIAKEWLTISDLIEIRNHKIGHGKIGGKSAGMLLASRIIQEVGDEDLRDCISIPESYYIGADLMYTFMSLNNLMHWADQKYKSEEQIRSEFPQLQQEFLAGMFPPEAEEKLGNMLDRLGNQPLIVRSSSLLEDNFGTSFAGKYDSYFCPNQATPSQNLRDLTQAIQKIYASALKPDALLYRHAKCLLDYDERMALLIQVVQGEQFGRYLLPHAAGVAFSRNLYRWSPQIRREDGFVRLVWGLGTRAVDRVANDYPRLVALSHPQLHPELSPRAIRRYSQHYVDLIDLKENMFKMLRAEQVMNLNYPVIRHLVQVDQGDYLTPLRIALQDDKSNNLVLTFEGLLLHSPFTTYMSRALQTLEKHYQSPVDMEFTVQILNTDATNPAIQISLLQCRPQSHLQAVEVHLPQNLADEDILFLTHRMAPQGRVDNIEYVVFVSPVEYFSLATPTTRAELSRLIGRLNAALAETTFICIGPGRWGTVNPDLGVPVGYADIYNTRALIELTGSGIGPAPEASFGTHFFQDLVESNIYPIAIYLNDTDTRFSWDFFQKTPNRLSEFLPEDKRFEPYLRLIKVSDYRPDHTLVLVMDDEQGKSVAFFQMD